MSDNGINYNNNYKNSILINDLKPLIITATVLLITGFIGSLLTRTSLKGSLSLMFAIFFYLILPGYCILLNIKDLTNFERIVLGTTASSAIIPSILYGLNVIGFKLTILQVMVVVLGVVAISSINYLLKKIRKII